MTDDEEYWPAEDDEDLQCHDCKGTGYVNPLTAPKGFFCVSTTECPSCEGTGEIQ